MKDKGCESMRIDTYLFFSKLMKDDRIQFIEGNLITGKIQQVEGRNAWISIKGFGTIKAVVEGDIKELVGKEYATFIVNSVETDKIKLKVVSNDVLKDSTLFEIEEKEYLHNILKEFNVRVDELSIDLLENFLKYNIKIDKESFVNGINILDKLNQIVNMEEDDIITSIDSKDSTEAIENRDIRNILVVKGNDKDNLNEQRVAIEGSLIKEINGINSDTIKTVAFLIKHGIKPTLNNIRFFTLLNEKPEHFLEDYEILKNYYSNEFTKFHKNIIIKNEISDGITEETIREYIKWLTERINFFKTEISHTDEKVSKALKEYADKMEFIKELNNNLVFIYIPFILERDYKEGIITLLKDKRNKNKSYNKVSIYISLNTNNFGKLKIVCQVKGSHIYLKFENLNKEHLDFFKSKEEELKKLVKTTGYEIYSIEYNTDSVTKILDMLMENPDPMYYLNVKV